MNATAPAVARPAAVAPAGRPAAGARLLFVDNLRVFLTVLVIVHHLMITYAGSGSWYYTEGRQDFATLAVGSWFLSVNPAFFMGLFLLISAYFVPGAYDRKGAGRFLGDRLVRLGIPLALYSWVVDPIFVYLLRGGAGGLGLPFWRFYPGRYFAGYGPLIGAGPLWFIETLLIFSAAYLLWRLTHARPAGEPMPARFPGAGATALFGLLLGTATFLVRLVFPVDWSFKPLNLQFPHFAQYVALFVAGLLAYRRDWLRALPDRAGRLWLAISGMLILLFVPMALALDAANNSALFKGGPHPHAFIYALWESFLCVGLCIGLIYLFRRCANGQGGIARFLSRHAYAAFIIHAPVITFLALAIRDLALYPLLKFGLVALVAVPLSFALGSLVRRLPYADRVL